MLDMAVTLLDGDLLRPAHRDGTASIRADER
jgi:hypothetical protein